MDKKLGEETSMKEENEREKRKWCENEGKRGREVNFEVKKLRDAQ